VYNEDSPERAAGWAFSSPSANTDRRDVQSSKLDRNWSNITQDGGRFDTGYHVQVHIVQRLMLLDTDSHKYRIRSQILPMPHFGSLLSPSGAYRREDSGLLDLDQHGPQPD
jgi:hypothetical protein